MTDVEKLLLGRQIIDDYKTLELRYGNLPSLVSNRYNGLLELGFSYNDFLIFNLKMNILEIDQNARFRKRSNLNEPALCDGCVGRAKTSCLVAGCSQSSVHLENRNPDLDYHAGTILGLGESQAIQEQKSEAERLSITPYMYLSPMNLIIASQLTEYHTPVLCIGSGHFITEPRFDCFWGMEQFIAIGTTIGDKHEPC